MERYAEAGNPAAPLMPTERGGHVDANTFGFYFRKAREAVGAPGVRLHDLRLYAVSAQIRAGANVAEAQALARHASARMTLETYTHAFGDAEDNNAERMGQVYRLATAGTPA